MSAVGKTSKPKVTTPKASTLESDDKPVEPVQKTDKGKEKAVELEPNKEKDNKEDTLIRRVSKVQVKNIVLLIKSAKVVLPPKFKGDFLKLKEFITKLKIYISYNYKSFDDKDFKVLFVISYLEGLVFDFI